MPPLFLYREPEFERPKPPTVALTIHELRKVVTARHKYLLTTKSYEEAHERANQDLSVRYNQPFDRLVDRYCVPGPPDQCAERLAQYVEAGVRHFIFVPIPSSHGLAADLETYAHEVVPRVRAALD